MRRAVALVLAALALSCAAPAYATRTVAVDAANAVHAFVVGSDGALYHAPPRDVLHRLGGSGLAQEPVAAIRDATGSLVVAARAEDGTVFVLPGGEWSARVHVATGAAGSPDLVLNQDGRLELFFRGVDGKLWTAHETVTGWSAAETLDGTLAGDPAAAVDASGAVHVVARGTDGTLQHFTGGAWETSEASVAGDPASVRVPSVGLAAFARRADGALVRSSEDAGVFKPGVALAADAITGTPAVVIDGLGRVRVFARGTDDTLLESTASGWTSLGGTLTGDPAAIRDQSGLVHVIAPSVDGSWVEFAQTGPDTWEPTIRALGGAVPPADPPPVVVVPVPLPPPVIVSPVYAPKRLLVDLKADAKASKTSAVFKALTVRGVPAGATITATCAKGCKRTSLRFSNVSGTVSLKPFFAKRAKQGTLKVGTKIRVVVSAPNMIAAVKTLTVRARKAPTVATRCLAPGATVETLCAA